MADIIIPWSGNHASIPAGWSRYTALDNKFPKASGTEAAEVTGGATTHTHTSSSHTHAIVAHTHTFTSGAENGAGTGNTTSGSNLANKTHTHSGTTGAATGGTTSGTAVTYATFSNNPPYYEVIFIKSALTSIPNDSMIMWDQTNAPTNTNYKLNDGNNSTVNLNGKYIKSANTAGNAGGTGGTTTNTHSITHTHSVNAHDHGNVTTGTPSSNNGQTNMGGGSNAISTHTHTASITTKAQSINSYSTSLVTAETVQPTYTTLMAYQNKAGSAQNIPLNAIAMTIDSTLPTGWTLCDGTLSTTDLSDTFIKISTSSGNIGNTGGANTHTHVGQPHTHTSTGGHVHSIAYSSLSSGFTNVGTAGISVAQYHGHATANSASTSASYAAGSTSAASSANQPEYVVVKYIQKITESGGGASMLFLFT